MSIDKINFSITCGGEADFVKDENVINIINKKKSVMQSHSINQSINEKQKKHIKVKR